MKYAVTWTLPPELTKAGIGRFLDTGAPPPAGVKMIGRWHGLDGSTGFIIAESADPKAIYGWTAAWADVVKFTVVPVLEDSEAAGVLQSQRK